MFLKKCILMRRSFIVVFLACIWMSSAVNAGTLSRLYQNRLLFDEDGRPEVTVRLMQSQNRIQLFSDAGLHCFFDDQSIWRIPPKALLTVELKNKVAAKVQRYAILETLVGTQRKKAPQRLRYFQSIAESLGVKKISMVSVGGVYGVHGTVVDNRALLVTAEKMPILEDSEKYSLRPIEGFRLLELPASSLKISSSALGERSLEGEHAALRCASARKEGVVVVKDVEHDVGFRSHGREDRAYRQQIAILPGQDGLLTAVNIVNESTLVAGVLSSEMFASAPIEALKAQAVTARGELFSKIGRIYLADPFLTCSSQLCQVYRGVKAETPSTEAAAAATSGELAFNGTQLIDSVYSACAGGHTAAAHVVWAHLPKAPLRGGPDTFLADPAQRPWAHFYRYGASGGAEHALAYGALLSSIPLDLRSEKAVRRFLKVEREETFSGRSTFNQKHEHYRWQRHFTADELQEIFVKDELGKILSLEVVGRGSGGRLKSLKIKGQKKTLWVQRELPVRRKMRNLRSGLFVIDEERDAAGNLLGITIQGAGYGHGAGMSQQGAIGMAEAGLNYRQILHHYYGGAKVRRVF